MKKLFIILLFLLLSSSVCALDIQSINDFGVVGDGVTDDTYAINEAVSYTAGNAILRFERGHTYMVNASVLPQLFDSQTSGGIELVSGSVIDLNGATLKVIPNALAKYAVFLVTGGADSVIIKNGYIVGDRVDHIYGSNPAYPTDEMGYGVQLINTKNVTIENVSFSDFTGDGIFTAADAGGISPDNVIINKCSFAKNRRQGISITRGNNIKITENSFEDIGGTAPGSGVDIESGAEDKATNIIISNNTFKSTDGYSVNQFDGVGVVISDNICDMGISYGYGTDTTISGNVINFIPKATGYQFGITGLDSDGPVTVSGNSVSNASVGVYIKGSNINVSGNTISASREHGISVVSTAADIKISNNDIYNAGIHGVSVHSPNVVHVSDNTIINAGSNGVDILNSTSSTLISSNYISGFKKGIYAQGDDCLILRNMLIQGDYPGADKAIHSSCATALIKGNTLQSVYGNYGIYVYSANIIDNVIRDFNGYMEIYAP